MLLAVAILTGAWWWWQDRRTTYEEALATLPVETLRASYTDWAAVRGLIGAEPIDRFVKEAYERDLSRLSALEVNGVLLEETYGIDLREVEWEAYAQSAEGSVAVLSVTDATGFDGIRDVLGSLGYDEPDSDDGAWAGSEELIANLDRTATPILQNLVLLEDDHLVVLSDDAAYAEGAGEVVRGDADSLLPEVADLAEQAEDPVSAVLWAADYACDDLAMSSADDSDQERGRALVDDAGGVSPVLGLLMAAGPAGDVRVAFGFESDDQAAENLQPRTDLASGEAPGLGGAFPDRFKVTAGATDGRLVVLDLEPVEDEPALLSAISDGPVLFATC